MHLPKLGESHDATRYFRLVRANRDRETRGVKMPDTFGSSFDQREIGRGFDVRRAIHNDDAVAVEKSKFHGGFLM